MAEALDDCLRLGAASRSAAGARPASCVAGGRTRRQTIVASPNGARRAPGADVVGAPHAAAHPAGDSVDAVLLPHTLEFEADPHAVLREVDRVLTGEGKLIDARLPADEPLGPARRRHAQRLSRRACDGCCASGAYATGSGCSATRSRGARRYLYEPPWGEPIGGPRDAAPRTVQSAARRRLPDQGAQARLRSAAAAACGCQRAPPGARRPRRTVHRARPLVSIVEIYTDGACRGNPGPGGWGALLSAGEHRSELSGAEADTTNNRMELTAAIRRLRRSSGRCRRALYTDSEYVRHGITEWLPNWKRAAGAPPTASRSRTRICGSSSTMLAQRHEIEWQLGARAMPAMPGNERVDRLANAAIDALLGVDSAPHAPDRPRHRNHGPGGRPRPPHHRDRLRRAGQPAPDRPAFPPVPEPRARHRRGRARPCTASRARAPGRAALRARSPTSSSASCDGAELVIHNARVRRRLPRCRAARLPGECTARSGDAVPRCSTR